MHASAKGSPIYICPSEGTNEIDFARWACNYVLKNANTLGLPTQFNNANLKSLTTVWFCWLRSMLKRSTPLRRPILGMVLIVGLGQGLQGPIEWQHTLKVIVYLPKAIGFLRSIGFPNIAKFLEFSCCPRSRSFPKDMVGQQPLFNYFMQPTPCNQCIACCNHTSCTLHI
jgi:hypothetical protein